MNTIFIFSLPRSGSTLLQRSLASHKKIFTTSEPWIIIPGVFSFRKHGIYSIYGHRSLATAHEDMCISLNNNNSDYTQIYRKYIESIYENLAGNNKSIDYFVDKTPRYHLICEEIIRIMPDAKFIFLWRNPLATAASILQTWGEGNWNLYKYWIDLYEGFDNLLNTYNENKRNVLSVRYEDFISNPNEQLLSIFDYLEIQYDESCMTQLSKLNGRLGDQTGINEFNKIDSIPLHRWKDTFNNPLRKKWANKYLKWLGEKRLKDIGYSLDDIRSELQDINNTYEYILSDMYRMPLGEMYNILEPHIFKDKIRKLIKGESVYCLR